MDRLELTLLFIICLVACLCIIVLRPLLSKIGKTLNSAQIETSRIIRDGTEGRDSIVNNEVDIYLETAKKSITTQSWNQLVSAFASAQPRFIIELTILVSFAFYFMTNTSGEETKNSLIFLLLVGRIIPQIHLITVSISQLSLGKIAWTAFMNIVVMRF